MIIFLVNVSQYYFVGILIIIFGRHAGTIAITDGDDGGGGDGGGVGKADARVDKEMS